MKEICCQYASYNVWANQRLLKLVLSLPEEQMQQEMVSSFKSVYATLLHMWDAEAIWWQRMRLLEQVEVPSLSFKPTLQEVGDNLLKQGRQWEGWCKTAQDYAFTHEFVYRNSKKQQFKQPVWQVLMHLYNHGTFHRGQIVTLLRQAGQTEIPGTDFILYTRGS